MRLCLSELRDLVLSASKDLGADSLEAMQSCISVAGKQAAKAKEVAETLRVWQFTTSSAVKQSLQSYLVKSDNS